MNLDNGLKDIFVLRYSGECVFHHAYSQEDQIEPDQAIMSSFLSAIESFSSEVDKGTEILEMTESRFIYHRQNDFIYVARTNKTSNPDYFTRRLNHIASVVAVDLPEEWDGCTDAFRGVGNLIQDQFDEIDINKNFEITGKFAKNLDDNERKVYSLLRFKGRASIRNIAALMKISNEDAFDIANQLSQKELVLSY